MMHIFLRGLKLYVAPCSTAKFLKSITISRHLLLFFNRLGSETLHISIVERTFSFHEIVGTVIELKYSELLKVQNPLNR